MKRDRILRPLFLAVAVGSLLPFGASLWWGFELFTHFRVQIVIACVLLASLAVADRRRGFAVALAVLAVLNARPLLPYLPSAPWSASAATLQSAPPGSTFDVLTINVNSENSDHAAITAAILSAEADVVALIELTPELEEALAAIADRYPHRLTIPSANPFGIGVFSRYPLQTATEFATVPTSAVDGLIELPSGPVRLIAAHLQPPIGGQMAATRNLQLEALAAHASGIEGPLLVCGDFNLSPYSPFFNRFTETARLRDTRLGLGFGISWPSFFPLAGIPIDHCLIRGPLTVESIERLERFGSDHYPVLVSLSWQENE